MNGRGRLDRLRAPCQWGPPARVALLLATLWVVLWGLGYAIFLFTYSFVDESLEADFDNWSLAPLVLGVHFLTILGGFAVFMAYALDFTRNPRLESERQRVTWAVAMVVGTLITMMVYWVRHLRPGLPRVSPRSPRARGRSGL